MRKFEEYDYQSLCDWMARRNMTAPPKEFLPAVGIIEEATACGFLIETNTPVAILEFFISNPMADKKERDIALSDIGHALTITAKRMGYKMVICNTKFKNINEMALAQGFNFTGEYSTYYKEIS